MKLTIAEPMRFGKLTTAGKMAYSSCVRFHVSWNLGPTNMNVETSQAYTKKVKPARSKATTWKRPNPMKSRMSSGDSFLGGSLQDEAW